MATWDPHWQDVVSLIRFDGEIGSGEVVDETGREWTATAGVQISDEWASYGNSAKFNGSSGRITTAASPDLVFDADFTIELDLYITSLSAPRILFHQQAAAGGNDRYHLGVEVNGSVLLYWGPSTTGYILANAGTISANTRHRLALVRSLTQLILFVDGVQKNSQTLTDTFSFDGNFEIGVRRISSYAYWYLGYIDEFRITKGVARYTSSYLPDDEPFPATDQPPNAYGEITGTVAINETPAERDLIAISYAKQTVDERDGGTVEKRVVVGETRSAPDGNYTLQTPGFLDEVIVLALDNYGEVWRPNRTYEVGQRIRPTKGNETGYGYDITVAGNSGETEPLWWVPAGGSDTGQIGTATAQARPLWWSVAHAPIQPDVVEPEEPAP